MQFQCPIGVSENPSSNPNGPKAMDVHEEKKPGLTIVPPGWLTQLKVDKKIKETVKQMEAKGQSGSIYVSDEGQHLKSQNSKAIISFVFNAS